MNILFMSHIFPPAIDGGSKVIFKLSQQFKKHGFKIKYFSSNCYSTDDFTKLSHRTQPKGLPVISIFHKPFKLLSKIFPIFSVFATGPIFSPIAFILKTINILKFKPDYIIAGPLPTTVIIYAYFFKLITKPKLIINASFHPTDKNFFNQLLLYVLKKSDFIWTLTDHESTFMNSLGIDQSKILNLGNGVDQNFLKLNKSTNNHQLIYIGSFAAHKNIKVLINAFKKIFQKYPNSKLILAGQKTLYFPKIKKLIKHPNIKLILNFSNSKLANLIDSSEILISPSTQESFGLVLIEAMARSKPVIGANIPATSEIISKSNSGLIFNNQGELVKHLDFLFSNPPIKKRFGSNGYQYVKSHYTWDIIFKQICQKLSLSAC
ncbi:MAG TPA: glycosyltransferase family 4 protein [Candidatus Woesebacteria bacterium]|nr:glycosyltransferase family 4 protein [Candidatus Woesebacteria bacterium]